MSTTPQIKFEDSPAESLADSFTSTPGSYYPSLFANNTMDPIEVMTPQSYEGESTFGGSIRGESVSGDTPAPEKKPVKKRKSWGQQLPEPKTNLPPRKRAKTEDEKEQRRVERVLRNRRAAQSSRERKRQEVEALEAEKRLIERRNQDLEMRLAHMEEQNLRLQQQLEQVTGNKMTVFRGSSAASTPSQELSQARPQVTFSQELFSSRDSSARTSISTQPISESSPAVQTVDPASLSPEILPVDESTNASSSDMTQHPAAMLCDLQCQSEEQRPWMTSMTATTSILPRLLAMTMFINMTSAVTSTLLNPLSQIISSLRTGSSLSPTTSILTMIIWLVTTTAALTTSTSTISSTTTTRSRPRFSLRISLLRRLLACSPNLARPLMDATMVAMRSASEQQLTRDCLSGVDASVRLDRGTSPSVEVLMTLLWAITVIEKERKLKTPKLDAATEVRQACDELDEMFRPRDIKRVSFVTKEQHIGGAMGQKSLEGWRKA
ncbi:transcriptional activator hac1 [Halenospora varia]|nr:transcriptional activator hac1 [Halenospora varia]